MAKTVIYTKVGLNKGTLRLWVQGRKLARGGINIGDTYSVDVSSSALRLVVTPEGKRTVSKKKERGEESPLIDLNNKSLEKIFKEGDAVRIVVSNGSAEVTLHHSQRAKVTREDRIIAKIKSGEPLMIGSICHGGGILDNALHAGLVSAGITPYLSFANEIEEKYLEVSLANNPIWESNSIALNAPMQEVEWKYLSQVDVLCAGLPCTGASLSGRSKNKLKFAEQHETAGSLFVAYLKAVELLKPAVLVLENVPPYLDTISYHVINSVLSEMDYRVSQTVLSGRDFGALENRKRMCMVAVSSGLPELDIETMPLGDPCTATLGDYLSPVPLSDAAWKSFDYLVEKEKRDIEAGKGFRRQLVNPSSTEIGTIGKGYAKARSTEPFLESPAGDGKSRLLTVSEHARVKTIPEHLVKGTSQTTGHEILGQSVIHSVFEAVGRWLGQGLQMAC